MSEFVDYDAASKEYDNQRAPIALDMILESITSLTGKQMADLNVLDAGCGTGNYSFALLNAGVGSISLFDASEGMLQCARDKLAVYKQKGRVGEIKQACLPTIPFGDGVFDVVMINMVLHHIKASSQDERKEIVRTVFKEVFRLLKKGGAFVLTTSFPDQYTGFWYVNLVPEVMERIWERYATRDTLSESLSTSGLSLVEFQSVLGSDWAPNYFDAEGPLHKEWRDIDSYWSLFTEAQLQKALSRVKAMKAEGTLNKFMLDNDRSTTDGNISLMKAIKQ